jgi:hypothetical protein
MDPVQTGGRMLCVFACVYNVHMCVHPMYVCVHNACVCMFFCVYAHVCM